MRAAHLLLGYFGARRWPALAAAAWLTATASAAGESPLSVTLDLYGGGQFRTADYRGRVLVLDLWTTWCAPCRTELATLDHYVAAHPAAVVAVAVLAERRPDARLLAAQAAALKMPIAFRPSAAILPLAGNAVPTTYILDRHGRVVLRKMGAFAPGELASRLDVLTATAGPAPPER